MAPIIGAAFLPHPPILLPAIGQGEEGKAKETIHGIKRVIQDIQQGDPEVLLIFSPHGDSSQHLLSINLASTLQGSFAAFGHPQLNIQANNQTMLAEETADYCRQEGLSFSRNKSNLDHGAMVPLYFLQKAGISLPVVHISVGWSDVTAAYQTGKQLSGFFRRKDQRIMVIASGDLSHRLKSQGPYGFHPKGSLFDEKIKAAFDNNNLDGLVDIPYDVANEAGQCGLLPFVLTAGLLADKTPETRCYSYQGPYGVGYLCGYASVMEEKQEHSAVTLARETIATYLLDKRPLNFDHYLQAHPGDVFLQRASITEAGAFVSIHAHGKLRGCIGTIENVHGNLGKEIVANAIEASTRDPRFNAVSLDELDSLAIKVDEMGSLKRVEGYDELDVQHYGVVVESGYRRGLLLPALEGVNTVEQQISIACQKAGISIKEPFTIYRFKVTRYE